MIYASVNTICILNLQDINYVDANSYLLSYGLKLGVLNFYKYSL